MLGAVMVAIAVAASTATPAAEEWIYTVRPGDTLWAVTERYLKDLSYVGRLQALNRIANPRTLPPGQELRIPLAWSRLRPAPAIVRGVTGDVTVRSGPAKSPRAVVPDMELHAGDVLATGPEGNVTLEYFDGYRLRLDADSELVLRALDGYSGTSVYRGEMQLPRGRIESRSPPRHDPATGIRVDTPGGVTSTRGTQFRVNAEPKQAAARTEVLDGSVDVTGAGQAVNVAAGFGTVARSGEPPRQPVPLLPAPDLAATEPRQRQVPVAIAIAPLPGAHAYRVQIAADPAFAIVLFDGRPRRPSCAGRICPTASTCCARGASMVRDWKAKMRSRRSKWTRGRFRRPAGAQGRFCRHHAAPRVSNGLCRPCRRAITSRLRRTRHSSTSCSK